LMGAMRPRYPSGLSTAPLIPSKILK
jgi:hypothetical protein